MERNSESEPSEKDNKMKKIYLKPEAKVVCVEERETFLIPASLPTPSVGGAKHRHDEAEELMAAEGELW